MSEGSGADGGRYRAFISYSHRDAVFAARLHRRLEGYVLPRRLGAQRRLGPIFKDREELPAAHDLSAQVRAALAVSDSLIIVCSPDAAASPWVGREIETFRALHPDRPILAALVRGEPAEAFPPALSAGGIEPLAADFRKEGDGERLGLLKLVAGMAGVGVDQLIQRDAQRRLRGVMAVTGVALAAVVAMGGMTVFALNARAEAERQRARAEGLVEFMLTDLRTDLKAVGRLDLTDSVNREVMSFYGSQDFSRLPAASLNLAALLLQAMGEDELTRGNLDGASIKFDEARRATALSLKKSPNDTKRIWAHGQSEYWQGYVSFLRKNSALARKSWTAYLTLSISLVKIEPRNPKYIRELAFAEGNLCTLAVILEKAANKALESCKHSADLMSEALRLSPEPIQWSLDLANRRAWLADAHELAGDRRAARAERLRQEALLDELQLRDPENLKITENWIGAQRALARMAFLDKDYLAARRRMVTVRDVSFNMTRIEPNNKTWRFQYNDAIRAIRLIDAK